MSDDYHCPQCGKPIGFGEAICPNCKADVTGVWEQKKEDNKPKVVPGMGMTPGNSPFPPSNNSSPFPPPANSSPFPPANNAGASPFPPASSSPATPAPKPASPFPSVAPGTGSASAPANPFASPTGAGQPFPPVNSTPSQDLSGPYLEISQIGGKLFIGKQDQVRFGRDEIQGCATKALPDLNAYKNISRKRENSEHFMVKKENDKYFIEDRGSTNGTYIGTQKITGQGPQELKPGLEIILPVEEHGKMVQLIMTWKKE